MDRAGLFRVNPKDGLDSALVAHIEGKVRPSYAIPRVDRDGEKLSPVIPLEVDGLKAAEEALDRGRDVGKGTRGRKPKPVWDVLMGGAPQFGSEEAWNRETIEEWADFCVAFIRRRFPSCTIAVGAIHLDETAPHVQLVVVMQDADGRLGQNRVMPDAVGEDPEEHRTLKQQKALMAKLQDLYFVDVSDEFDLGRGDKGGETEYAELDREIGRINSELDQCQTDSERIRLLAELAARHALDARAAKKRVQGERKRANIAETREASERERADQLEMKLASEANIRQDAVAQARERGYTEGFFDGYAERNKTVLEIVTVWGRRFGQGVTELLASIEDESAQAAWKRWQDLLRR